MSLGSRAPGDGIFDPSVGYDIKTHLRPTQPNVCKGSKVFAHRGIRQRKDDHVTFESLETVNGLDGDALTIQRGK